MNLNTDNLRCALVCLAIMAGLALPGTVTAAEEGHPHHLAAILGVTQKGSSKTAGTYGIEYTYRINQRFALGAWYEESSGDFDIESWGVISNVYLTDHLPLLIGAGAEQKLYDDKTKYLVRLGAQYQFHLGSVSIAPTTWVDLIENGDELWFVGVTLGIGF